MVTQDMSIEGRGGQETLADAQVRDPGSESLAGAEIPRDEGSESSEESDRHG